MDDLINSLEKKLLEFDQESIERDLTRREKKEKENLKYEIYWAKFKKFKADFERLIFTDVQELAHSLETALLEKNIVLKTETHIKKTSRFFDPDLPIYMILSISDKSVSRLSLWKRSPFLLIKGNPEGTIELYDCNKGLKYVSDYVEKKVWGRLIKRFKIDEYEFNLLKLHTEKWINRNVDKIRDNEDFIANN